MPEWIIRPAVPEDAPVLARIQTEAWKAAFGGILSPEAAGVLAGNQGKRIGQAETRNVILFLGRINLQCYNEK